MPSPALEQPGDLALCEHGHRLLPAAAHQGHSLLARHDLADEMTVDGFAREGVNDDAGVGRRKRHEEGARSDRAERIEPEGLAGDSAFREAHDAVAVDAEPDPGGIGELDERGRDAALGWIVHRVHRGQLAGYLGLRQNAESRALEKTLRSTNDGRRHTALAQLGFLLAGD